MQQDKRALGLIIDEFTALAQVPRPSHHEEGVSAYLYRWAKDHALEAERDGMGNVIIEKPAFPGCENAPRVILQAHMDMVCVAAPGVDYDPLKDPITVINDGAKLTAKGTSLGADDGIGVAMCLYILKNAALRHGPLRAVFTVNEEDGMSSGDMDEKYLRGEYLINLDWEWLGSLCNSSAGADFFSFSREALWAKAGGVSFQIRLSGLLGGHSGVEINKGHANALVSLATLLESWKQNGVPFHIAALEGGQARNAIPASAYGEVIVPPKAAFKAAALVEDFMKDFKSAYGDVEKEYAFVCTRSDTAEVSVLDQGTGYALVDLMATLPNNVHTMSPFVSGLVESSMNVGLASLKKEKVELHVMARSCSGYQGKQIALICRALGDLCGFTFVRGEHAPAWGVNPHSKLTAVACDEYKTITGRDMVVEPVHGGLECGAFAEKNPALDMIAIGPTLTNVHSPNEACDLQSVDVTTQLVLAVLERLA